MATVDKQKPYLAVAATAEGTLTLDRKREYLIKHNGVDGSGSASTDPVFLAYDATVTASYSAGSNRIILNPGESIAICPLCSVLHYISASGTPSFSVVPGPDLLGNH